MFERVFLEGFVEVWGTCLEDLWTGLGDAFGKFFRGFEEVVRETYTEARQKLLNHITKMFGGVVMGLFSKAARAHLSGLTCL